MLEKHNLGKTRANREQLNALHARLSTPGSLSLKEDGQLVASDCSPHLNPKRKFLYKWTLPVAAYVHCHRVLRFRDRDHWRKIHLVKSFVWNFFLQQKKIKLNIETRCWCRTWRFNRNKFCCLRCFILFVFRFIWILPTNETSAVILRLRWVWGMVVAKW